MDERGVMSRTRLPRRSATSCAELMRCSALKRARVCEMLLREPCTLTDTSRMPNALRIFHIVQLHRVPAPARRRRIITLVLAHLSSMSWKMVRSSNRSTCNSRFLAARHALTRAVVASPSLPRPNPAVPLPLPTTAKTEIEPFLPAPVTFDTLRVCSTCAKYPPSGSAPLSLSRAESMKLPTMESEAAAASSSPPKKSAAPPGSAPVASGRGYGGRGSRAAGESSSRRDSSSERRREETASSLSKASRIASASAVPPDRASASLAPAGLGCTFSSASSSANSRSS
mmetsp:Transcript_9483/g.31542  ORF Transcript_9483/g.31542 Transcript_9483/m.31542 type:complete len:285 (+) Transcript_9483:524-1378(+)